MPKKEEVGQELENEIND